MFNRCRFVESGRNSSPSTWGRLTVRIKRGAAAARAQAPAARHAARRVTPWYTSDHVVGRGVELFDAVCATDLEVVVAKWTHGRYHLGVLPTLDL
jgi:hypothetical protein